MFIYTCLLSDVVVSQPYLIFHFIILLLLLANIEIFVFLYIGIIKKNLNAEFARMQLIEISTAYEFVSTVVTGYYK